jgi:hypothetical protein
MEKGKKLPKWFWPVGIGVAVILGLWLRSRSQSNSQQQTSNTASDITSSPYYYTASGAYPDTNVPASEYYYGSSPYGVSSFLGNNGLPTGFDPTSFQEGISYAQSQGTTLNDVLSTAPLATPITSQSSVPGNITINLPPSKGQQTGSPKVSGRRKGAGVHKPVHHKPLVPKGKKK